MAEALYDIAEPGESKKKEACPPTTARAIGIDLGTTNSLVAIVRDANPVCLPDGEGRMLLPSAVRYRDRRRANRRVRGAARRGAVSARHDRVGQALHGARAEGRGDDAALYALRVRFARRAGRAVQGRGRSRK